MCERFERLSMISHALCDAFLSPWLLISEGQGAIGLVSFAYGFLGHVLKVRPDFSVVSPLNRGVDSVKISRGDVPPLR